MAGLVKCGGCEKDISPKAAACPTCGHPNDKAKHLSGANVLGALITLGVFIWWMAPSGGSKVMMDSVSDQVAKDAVQQYEMAQRSGDKIQICVHAGMVSAAYMQAKDEVNYQNWLRTEKRDCAAAGVPH